MKQYHGRLGFLCGIVLWAAVPALAADTSQLIGALRAVGPEAKGNAAASKAWQDLAKADAGTLPAILEGFDDANPLAINWLRAAVDAIAEREVAAGRSLPAANLEAFIKETRHEPRARRLAYEWLAKVDKLAPDRLIPTMADDPSVELRREAVERLIADADKTLTAGDKAAATAAFEKAMASARDEDQIQRLVGQLKKLDRPVDLPRHFGFLMEWKLIGPFDSAGGKGHHAVFPPEQNLDTKQELAGKDGPVRWTDHVTTDAMGTVNLNKAIGPLHGAAVYGMTEFTSDQSRPVEVRLACCNAWKVWLNGKLLFARDEYHRGLRLDQYKMKGELKEGKNVILVKICQNEQKDEWAQQWQYQLRVCDATGTAVLSKTRPPTPRSQANAEKTDKSAGGGE